MALTVTAEDHGDVTVLMPAGEIDLATAAILERAIDEAVAAGDTRLVVDLRSVRFCDSTGLTVFVRGHRQCGDHGGWLRLAAPMGMVAVVLKLSGLAESMTFDSIDAAVAEPTAPRSG